MTRRLEPAFVRAWQTVRAVTNGGRSAMSKPIREKRFKLNETLALYQSSRLDVGSHVNDK